LADVIFDGTHLQALHEPRGGDTVLITFNEMDSFANGRNYWAEALARGLNLSVIGIMTKAKNWFPAPDMADCAAAIAPLAARYRNVVAYGFSQGAYAAIKYSSALGATHVLAFSPQWTIDPEQTRPWDRRFAAFYDPALHADMAPRADDTAGIIRLFVDPCDRRDYPHAQRIAATSDRIRIVPCFNIGHGTVRAVSSTRTFAELLEICLNHGADITALAAIIRASKKRVFAYYYALGYAAIRRRHRAIAASLIARARAINPNHPELPAWQAALDKAAL
jgi:hypothetical protein